MKLSIVIVNYNVEHFLEQCLLSVRKAAKPWPVEIFVVDNNSVDGSVPMLREKFPEVLLIENRDNTGFSRANNQAMRRAQGEYVLLLNPDTLIEEDTLVKVVQFMDEHEEAGGLGVKMVDGTGRFLPESKRGLPTPFTAFCKISGLSKIFPRSARFNRYHLGHLSMDELHEVEILSGAFMLLRKKALDQVGLLDETFFMYGEDIDLSYRLVRGGWKNYYFPHTRIIHYKGESTKKGSLNYVFVFYNAMVIFAHKHFTGQRAWWLTALIHSAIWARAAVAVMYRFARKAALPLADGVFTFAALVWLMRIYAQRTHNIYDPALAYAAFSGYVFIWCICAWLGQAYDRPLRPQRAVLPLLAGSAVILLVYALLPESLRFSRALILMGTVAALFIFVLNRTVWSYVLTGGTGFRRKGSDRTGIVGSAEECQRVAGLLHRAGYRGEVKYMEPATVLAEGRLSDMVRVHNLGQVVFCARDVQSSDIISLMATAGERQVEFKIAPPESLFLIGSGSVVSSSDAFMFDINSVSKPANRRLKRVLDVMVSLVAVTFWPLLAFTVKNPIGLLRNAVQVMAGRKTWVGFHRAGSTPGIRLPKLRPGVLHPGMRHSQVDEGQLQKLDLLYARDYRLANDLAIIAAGWRHLGD